MSTQDAPPSDPYRPLSPGEEGYIADENNAQSGSDEWWNSGDYDIFQGMRSYRPRTTIQGTPTPPNPNGDYPMPYTRDGGYVPPGAPLRPNEPPSGTQYDPTRPVGNQPYMPYSPTPVTTPSPGGGNPQVPSSGGWLPSFPISPTTPTSGGGGGRANRTESSYSYGKPVHTFDPATAKNYAPALARENIDGLKFTDLLERESGNLPFNDLIAREQAPDQQYGKQQALEAANEANALLAQGLNRRHADIAGSLGARGMGEGGASARLGDLATAETLGQQSSNIRQAYENAAKYGDQRSLDIFGKQIGQRDQDISQRSGLNQNALARLGLDVSQRGMDVGMANELNQAGLNLNNQRIAQRGQDVDQQKTVAQIIQSLLGQDQREAWSNSQGSSSGGGDQGWATEAGLGSIMNRVFNML